MKPAILLLVSFIQFSTYFCVPDYDIRFDRAEGIPGQMQTLADYSGVSVKRIGADYFLNGTFSYKQNFDLTNTIEIVTYRSNGGAYTRQGFGVIPTPACLFFQTTYKTYGQPMFMGKSNFPLIPAGLCTIIPMGDYYVNGARIEDIYEILPSHLNPGFWRVDTVFRNLLLQVVGGLRIEFAVTSLVGFTADEMNSNSPFYLILPIPQPFLFLFAYPYNGTANSLIIRP